MNKYIGKKHWGIAIGIISAVMIVSVAHADEKVKLSPRAKTIVIDNLDNALFSKGDPAMAATAQAVCGDCHSSDYPMTQPKLNCGGWGKTIVKMGNTFQGVVPWNEDGLQRETLKQILAYLTDNYGSGGSAACTGHELDSLPLTQ